MDSVMMRAATFAAPAEPARLRMVDMLAVGDLSPTEIQLVLGMSSNLVAHHLGVLEAAGVLSRAKSEADGRRNYVRLVPGAFDGLTPGPMAAPQRVVFVCTANSARSRLAEAIWREASRVPVASAGTVPADAVNPGAIAAAARQGLTIAGVKPASYADVVEGDDFVVTVCDRAHEQLGGRDDVHWSVPDPARVGTDEAFDGAFADLRHRIDGLTVRMLAAS